MNRIKTGIMIFSLVLLSSLLFSAENIIDINTNAAGTNLTSTNENKAETLRNVNKVEEKSMQLAQNAIGINLVPVIWNIYEIYYERCFLEYFSVKIDARYSPHEALWSPNSVILYGGDLEFRYYINTSAPKDFYIGISTRLEAYAGSDQTSFSSNNITYPVTIKYSQYTVDLGMRLGKKWMIFDYNGPFIEAYIGYNLEFGPLTASDGSGGHGGVKYSYYNNVNANYYNNSFVDPYFGFTFGVNAGWAF